MFLRKPLIHKPNYFSTLLLYRNNTHSLKMWAYRREHRQNEGKSRKQESAMPSQGQDPREGIGFLGPSASSTSAPLTVYTSFYCWFFVSFSLISNGAVCSLCFSAIHAWTAGAQGCQHSAQPLGCAGLPYPKCSPSLSVLQPPWTFTST